MANEQNLRPCEHKFTQEEAKRGGRNSAKARREQKTIQKLLQDYLENDVKSNKALLPLADKAGIKGNQSIKELVTAVCIINTLKKGDVDKLGKITELLGEDSMLGEIEDLTDVEDKVFGDG